MDLELVKRVGIAAAYRGGNVLRSYYGKLAKVDKKGDIDLVTEADTAAEKVVIEIIKGVFPDHAILAEESGLNAGNYDYQWIVDPLDGTTNFAHDLGLYSISIAFALDGETVLGIVLIPESGEMFTAVKDSGAELNGKPIRVSAVKAVSDSLLITGFPYDLLHALSPLMTRFANCLKASQGVRRLGSAAIDLCYVACGRFEAFWEQNLKPWDTAAGECIAREAGATITDFSNQSFSVYNKEILATNGNIHDEMLSLLKLPSPCDVIHSSKDNE